MSIDTRLRESKRAHLRLRSEPAMSGDLAERAEMYKGLKTVMDEIWVAIPPDHSAKTLRGAIRRLIVDAEYAAGLSDIEGMPDPNEVWTQYAMLERRFACDDGNA